jgi:hypothetical protein
MYLQITTRCNMSCGHCAFACGAKGEDMSIKVVEAALEAFGGEGISIGGGEPTVHPRFWQIFGIVLSEVEPEGLWMATNGKRTKDALRLANLARRGVLGVALSLDQWHDRIDPDVIKAFQRGPFGHGPGADLRETRMVQKVSYRGRVEEWDVGEALVEVVDWCVCEDIVVDPSGAVWSCGCKEENFGNVLTGFKIPDEYWERDTQCARAALVEA